MADVVTLALAVDSTQVNSAAAALDKMAASGGKAEAVASRLAKSASDQGKALASAGAGASKTALSFKSLAEAQEALGPAAANQLAAAGAFGAIATQATAAKTAVQGLNAATAAATSGSTVRSGGLSGLAAEAVKAKTAVVDLSKATTSLGASSFVNFDKVTTSLGATEAQANAATRAVHQLRNEIALVGPLATATTSLGAAGAAAAAAAAPRGQLGASSPTPQGVRGGTPIPTVRPGPVVAGNEAIAKSAKLAAFQQQQLGFQIHDFFVQIASGGSPLTAFVQQGSQLSGTFGGAGNAFRAVTSLITPFRLAVGGAVGVVAALGFAMLEGQRRSKEFGDAILVSGNYAAQTEGKFNALARAVSASKETTVGNVRDIGIALLRTGEVGPQVFQAATEAAVGYAQATGKTADQVAKDFALMARSPTKFAAEANRQLNFITAAQYEAIKAFEENGRAADAQGVIYDALNARFPKLDSHLNGLTATLSRGQNAWTRFWDSAIAPATIESRIADIDARLQASAANRGNVVAGAAAAGGGQLSASQAAALRDERAGLARQQFRQSENAAADAFKAEANKAAIAADAVVDGYLKRGKAASTYKQKLDELNRSFQAKELAGVPVSKADQAVAIGQLKKDFTPAGSGRKNTEPDQIRREELAAKLEQVQAAFDRERDALAFHNRFLQGEYQAGNLSLREFYEAKQRDTAAGVAAEIALLQKEKDFIAEDLAKPGRVNDPSERLALDRKSKKLTAQQEEIRVKGAQQATLANQEEAASYKQLADQVLNYRANLLQLQGDEAGAAKLRAQAAIEQARTLARQAEPRPTAGTFARLDRGQRPDSPVIDVEGMKKAIDQQNALTEARNRTSAISQQLQIDEERIGLAQRTGAIGEIAAMQQAGAARAKVIPELEKIVAAQEEIAAQIGNEKNWQLQIDTSRWRLELEKLKAEIDPLKEKFDTLFKDAGANFLEDLANGAKPKDALKSWAASISREINAVAANEISGQIFGKGGIFGGAGGFFAKAFGGKDKPTIDTSSVQQSFSTLQVAGIDPSITALQRFQQALDATTDTVGNPGSASEALIASRGIDSTALPTGDFARLDRGQPTGEQSVMDLFRDANRSSEDFGRSNAIAAQSVVQLARAAGKGGDALGLLPQIIQAIQAMAASGGGSSGGGLLGSLFGGGSSFAAGGSAGAGFGTGSMFGNMDLGLFLHSGGVVGQTSDMRPVPRGAFANARKYHSGGIAGLAADEVPAILMGGPRGKREEVLHARDPRHRDNLRPLLASGGPGAGKRGDTFNVQVTAGPGVTREQAMNQGRDIQRGMQVQMGRRSRNS